MTIYFKRSIRFFGLVALVPFIIAIIGVWNDGIGFLLFLFGIPAMFIVLLIGADIWFSRGVKLARKVANTRNKAVLWASAPALLIATVLMVWPLLAGGKFIGNLARLAANQSRYQAIITKAQVDQKPASFEEYRGVTYSVDLGPPIRVAFNPAGMLDNWSGIVFDPTGDVMKADGFDAQGKFFAPDRITRLFGGDLVSCRHLWGDYYSCSFT